MYKKTFLWQLQTSLSEIWTSRLTASRQLQQSQKDGDRVPDGQRGHVEKVQGPEDESLGV